MAQTSKLRIIWNIPRLAKAALKAFKDSSVPKWRKIAVLIIGSAYFMWPLDLIPDLPLLGQLDDLGVLFLLLNWLVSNPRPDKNYIEADYYIDQEEFDQKEEKKSK